MRSPPEKNSSISESRTLLFKLNSRSEAMEYDKAVEVVADRYRSEGYQVTVRPKDNQVPEFAAGLNADLLATKDDEHVFVQVKENREGLRDDVATSNIADVVNARPGWRLDLVVLNGDSTDKLAREAPEPSADVILRKIDDAEQSARNGEYSTSFIIAWASLEAAMRRAARAADIEIQHISPLFLLRTLYSNGLLERREVDELSGYLRYRNAVVHGLEAPKFDATPTLYVAGVARKLLEGATVQS
jgi:hypothetical protein